MKNLYKKNSLSHSQTKFQNDKILENFVILELCSTVWETSFDINFSLITSVVLS